MFQALAHDGAVIDVHATGSGPSILLHPQPGYPGSPPELLSTKATLDQALVRGLSDRYRLIMFEYPGDPKPRTLTPRNVVADLLAIADAAGTERFAWCGYSWTAVIGLQLAINTDRLTGLICGGWPPICAPYKEILANIRQQAQSLDANRTALSERGLQQFATFYRALQAFDDQDAQRLITCPRLCFVGSSDDINNLGIGRRVTDQRETLERSGWDVRILEGLDHSGPLKPAVFVPIVGDWLDKNLGR